MGEVPAGHVPRFSPPYDRLPAQADRARDNFAQGNMESSRIRLCDEPAFVLNRLKNLCTKSKILLIIFRAMEVGILSL